MEKNCFSTVARTVFIVNGKQSGAVAYPWEKRFTDKSQRNAIFCRCKTRSGSITDIEQSVLVFVRIARLRFRKRIALMRYVFVNVYPLCWPHASGVNRYRIGNGGSLCHAAHDNACYHWRSFVPARFIGKFITVTSGHDYELVAESNAETTELRAPQRSPLQKHDTLHYLFDHRLFQIEERELYSSTCIIEVSPFSVVRKLTNYHCSDIAERSSEIIEEKSTTKNEANWANCKLANGRERKVLI